MKKQKVMMAVMAAAFVLGNVVPAAAQAAETRLVIGNGTGGKITTMIISPAREQYPRNENRCAFQKLTVNDKAVFAVVIPENLRGMDTFDIEVISKGKRYVTLQGVKIDFNRGTPTLELSKRLTMLLRLGIIEIIDIEGIPFHGRLDVQVAYN